MQQNAPKVEGGVPRQCWSGPGRAALDRAIEAMRACADALADLKSALDSDEEGPQAALVIATTAILGAGQAAAEILDLVARVNAGKVPGPKYLVTCPECGAEIATEWTYVLPPGGVSPVQCSACGYMILSESEGNPVLVPDDPGSGAARSCRPSRN